MGDIGIEKSIFSSLKFEFFSLKFFNSIDYAGPGLLS